MKRSKMTKKALVFSVTSILLCIMMLIGSTFAWFTDSVTGGNNFIKAGNLDIELYHSNKNTAKEKVQSDTKLFEVELWEPGAMAYENFEISNEGDLALKYEFVMNAAEFNTVSETGKSLKDVLKIAVLEGEEFVGDREAAKNLTFDKTIENFSKKESLLLKGTKTKFAIVVYWEPTEADNDYNLNNGKTSSDNNPLFINLGIDLTATQTNFESDSFDDNYDDQIAYKEVATATDLLNNIYYTTDAEGVKLTQDIELPWGIPQSKNGISIIDLDGHTLSTSVDTSTVVANGNELTIKNGKLKLRSARVTSATLSIESGATLNLDNVEYTSTTAAGIFPKGKGTTINIRNSTITTYGHAISTNANSSENYDVNINIVNSTINGNNDGAGTAVLLNIPCNVYIDKSEINGYLHGIIIRGGTATIKDSTITNRTDKTTTDTYINMFDDKNWGSGSNVTAAALTIGNKDPNNYQYPSDVTLINTKIISGTIGDNTRSLPTVYIIGNEKDGLGATLTYDEASSVGEVVRGNEYVTVNGQ